MIFIQAADIEEHKNQTDLYYIIVPDNIDLIKVLGRLIFDIIFSYILYILNLSPFFILLLPIFLYV